MKSQAKPDRYLVLLESQTKSSLKKVQNELNINLISSQELNSKVRSFNVMSKDNGIVFKNLGIAVVDNIEEAQLKMAVKGTSPILHYEKEIEYRAIDEFDQLEKLKETSKLLQEQLEELEAKLEERQVDDDWDSSTWGIDAIGLQESKYRGEGIDVAILDTGFFLGHPDFVGRNVTGRSFIQGEAWDSDGNGHGTHCTGTALGKISLSDGMRYGVASEANIITGKVLSDRGSGSTSGIIDAIDWAIEKKYSVVSMSLGSPVGIGQNPSVMFEHVGKKALEKNCLLIAAAGNDSNRPSMPRPVSSPANCKSIMAIAALDSQLDVAYFSNGGINASNGGRIDLAAPGVNVFSSYSKNAPGKHLYRRLNGTSMATPHVAGLAALYFEAFPNYSASEIWSKMEKEAKKLSGKLFRDVGYGLAQSI